MIASTKNTSNPPSSTSPPAGPEATGGALASLNTTTTTTTTTTATSVTTTAIPHLGRIRSSSSCPYLPGLSGPASPAEVTKETVFGGVVDNSGKFSPRIVESEGGYFALRNNTPVGERDREPASPRIITSSTTLAAAGSSRTVITRDCGWGEMITGIESEGVETSHHHQYFLHRRTPSGTHESPEELLLRLKSKTSASNLTLQQIHQTAPTQRPSSSLSLSFTPTSSTAESLSTASISRKTAKTTAPHPNSKTSSRSPLRLRLPPPPRVQIDALGIGVPHIIFPHHPYHRLFPNTPDGRFYERRRESAPGLLVPGIHPRSGDWLLTPPEEVGGMLWHCPTPSDHIENIMADTQEELEGDDAKCVKHASRPATSDGTLSRTKDTALRREVVFGHGNVIKEEEIDARTAEEAEESTNFWVDDNWGAGEEWLRGAAEVLLSALSPVRVTQEAVRILSYTLPCPLPSSPDPSYVSVGAATMATHQGRLPASAKAAPAVAATAGQQLSPAITARCNSTRPNAGAVPVGSRDGVTTTIHTVTSAIQRRYGRDGTSWVYINVSHAIPPHIPLNRLPSIPMSGPLSVGPAGTRLVDNPYEGGVSNEGGGYFAPTIFNSIVVAIDGTPGPRPLGNPVLSNPILPPNSLHLSILERFIPPNSAADDAAMFSPVSSILVDRLIELNDNGGSLLFIYPTKTGAKQFVKNILGPVLDPLLRKLMVLHVLREDLLWRIRNMPAVDSMADWDALKVRMERLVASLSRASGGTLAVELAYASTAQIRVNDESWREWWCQQEQTRIREIVKRHFANMPPMPEKPIPKFDSSTPSVESSKLSSYPFPSPSIPETLQKSKAESSKPIGQKKGDVSCVHPPPSIDLQDLQSFKPTFLTPLSPEESAQYLGIRSPNLPISPYPVPMSTQPSSVSSSSHSSSGFTMGYGPPGDLAREVIDGVRVLAVRPSSKGMGEAVMASALAGSGGNTAIGQGMGGVVGEVVGRKEGAINRDKPGKHNWSSGPKESPLIEVGVFVLRRVRR